jgi:energy-coupling factor transport system ATP-binding protein
MTATPPVLSAQVVAFSYDGVRPVLRDVGLTLGQGSLTAVLGPSGSGTSTFAKVLAGWAVAGGHGSFEGYLEICPGARGTAQRLTFRGREDDPRLRLGAWGQHVALVPQRAGDLLTGASASVGEEIAFALEQRGVERGRMRARVELAAGAAGLHGLLGRHPDSLSGGEERRLALACAIVGEPSVLVLDDPTASLDAAGCQALWQLIESERRRGTAVVVTGAGVDSIVRRAEHWVLLQDGAAAATGSPADVLASSVFARSGVAVPPGADGGPGGEGHSATTTRGPAARPLRRSGTPGGSPVAALRDVVFRYPESERHVLDGVGLEIAPGEVVAITGPNGSGKSTALRHLAGLARPQAGRVEVGGRDIADRPAGRVAETVGTLFQDPRDQLFERSTVREVEFGLRLRAPGRRRPGRPEARQRAFEALGAVGLASAAGAHPYDLPASGQRLLALATVLARSPRLLLLDEPTVGLDGPSLARLESVVASAAEAGAGVVLSTHAVGWARRHAHRVLVLDGGRLVPA